MEKLIALVVSLGILVSILSGCIPTSKNVNGDANTLSIMLWGDKPAGWDKVLEKFHKDTKDTLGIKLNVSFTPQSDYTNKMKLKLTGGEEVDMVFDAPWMSMNDFIAQGNYLALDEYFGNDKYKGLKENFPDTYINNNKFNGKIYGVPITRTFGDTGVIFIRKDLREKYGMKPISNLTELEEYLNNIKTKEQNMTPFMPYQGYGFHSIYEMEKTNLWLKQPQNNIWGVPLAPGVAATIQLGDDNKTIKSIVLPGDSEEYYKNMPEEFKKKDYGPYEFAREWYEKGYIEKDIINRKDADSQFKIGKAGALQWTISLYATLEKGLTQADKNAKLEIFVIGTPKREMQEKTQVSDFKSWNFVCVPKSTKKVDKVMKFLNAIFEKRELHDLFELGIKGEHWEEVGTDKYKIPENLATQNQYTFQGYQLTWNPYLIRYRSDLPEDVIKYMKYTDDPSTYLQSKIAGFNFLADKVKVELAHPDLLTTTKLQAFQMGIIADPVVELKKLEEISQKNKTLNEAKDKIRAELETQLKAFFEGKK
jgi:putative aldouronate transport system substrate-binding protein